MTTWVIPVLGFGEIGKRRAKCMGMATYCSVCERKGIRRAAEHQPRHRAEVAS